MLRAMWALDHQVGAARHWTVASVQLHPRLLLDRIYVTRALRRGDIAKCTFGVPAATDHLGALVRSAPRLRLVPLASGRPMLGLTPFQGLIRVGPRRGTPRSRVNHARHITLHPAPRRAARPLLCLRVSHDVLLSGITARSYAVHRRLAV